MNGSGTTAEPIRMVVAFMRAVTFEEKPGLGPDAPPPRRGSLADLIMAMTYLVHDQIARRRVLNDVLTQASSDAGMSGGAIWEPFEIDDHEYDELVAEPGARRRPDPRPTGIIPCGCAQPGLQSLGCGHDPNMSGAGRRRPLSQSGSHGADHAYGDLSHPRSLVGSPPPPAVASVEVV